MHADCRATRRNDVSVQNLIDVIQDTPSGFAPGGRWKYDNSANAWLTTS
jgi:hypothetical protein